MKVKALEGDTVDSLCFRYYGTTQGVTEKVLDANGLGHVGRAGRAGHAGDGKFLLHRTPRLKTVLILTACPTFQSIRQFFAPVPLPWRRS